MKMASIDPGSGYGSGTAATLPLNGALRSRRDWTMLPAMSTKSTLSELNRRDLLRLFAASALAVPLVTSFGGIGRGDSVAPSSVAPATAPDGSPPLPTRFTGYRDLERLPYFARDAEGRLRLLVEDAMGAIDFHTHLGVSYFLAPDLDLLKRTEGPKYLFDCDGRSPPCELDLNGYQNRLADRKIMKRLRRWLVSAGLPGGSEASATHTTPNLLAEMDAMGIERAVVLPIALKLPRNANPTEAWVAAAKASAAPERLVMFGSVHPRDRKAFQKLIAFKALGVAGIKIHPPMQRIRPDHRKSMAIFQACDRLGLPVLFHSGRAGIEPRASRRYALIKHYEAPVREFPKLRFVLGHAGCRMDADDALKLAKANPNVWLEISGQGLGQLERITREFDGDRILYGTDWPYYPQSIGLAKVLMLTEGDKILRRRILRGNAVDFLNAG
jgi:predicted TIM-barrel fold metal-dependent hydrolase